MLLVIKFQLLLFSFLTGNKLTGSVPDSVLMAGSNVYVSCLSHFNLNIKKYCCLMLKFKCV